MVQQYRNREMNTMIYTTTANRDDLQKLNIPSTMTGSLFRVTITPIEDEEPSIVSFRNLKGIAGRELTLDDVKRERLMDLHKLTGNVT